MRLKAPPAVLFMGAAGLQWAMAPRRRSHEHLVAASAIACASGALALAGVREFARQRTTVDPRHVDAASALVVTGPNARTRNPMYVGMLGCLLAHALARGSLAASLPAAGFWWVIDHFQIPDEEQGLLESFGDAYEAYRARVPRWL
ncbi:MAG: isoprenylcysteine carboxylmethyltransferase family protein [Actinomycetaceae bacterium]|nr:isoprenylcysteine carboxylmethyltransferase family protein [Actinomycetaceae bacterium]